MATELRAQTNPRYRRTNAVIIGFVAALCCLSIVMIIYNLIKGSYLFMTAWIIAAILAGTYVIIRINTVFSTYMMTDMVSIYMKNWDNDFLPYDYDNKIKILSEFIPAKTKLVEIPLSDIDTILIGTKNFIKRNVDNDNDFVINIRPLEKTKDYYRKRVVSGMDIIYVETVDRECYYMPIAKFDPKDVVRIVQVIQKKNPDLVVKSSNRAYRRLTVSK